MKNETCDSKTKRKAGLVAWFKGTWQPCLKIHERDLN